jgi:hypothetical protein
MKCPSSAAGGLLVVVLLVGAELVYGGTFPAGADQNDNETLPAVVLEQAPLIQMPGVIVRDRHLAHAIDSNSPIHWDGNRVYIFNSYNHPYRATGTSIARLGMSTPVYFSADGVDNRLFIWIEATWKDRDGSLYGAYHYEPDTICSSNTHLPTAPKIGWIKSMDNGGHWQDLGFVVEANPARIDCNSASPWDAGGTGDLDFLPDRENKYFYIYGTSYDPAFEEQGIFVARLPYADRDHPSGRTQKWYKGSWSEPGLWGHVTPVFPAAKDYTHADAEMFWGPSIHWNTYLQMYVMVLNHAVDTKLRGGGVYISFNRDIGNPRGWSTPRMILSGGQVAKLTQGGSAQPNALINGWYPEIVGMDKGQSDKMCGRVGRLFITGMSKIEITFLRPGEKQPQKMR